MLFCSVVPFWLLALRFPEHTLNSTLFNSVSETIRTRVSATRFQKLRAFQILNHGYKKNSLKFLQLGSPKLVDFATLLNWGVGDWARKWPSCRGCKAKCWDAANQGYVISASLSLQVLGASASSTLHRLPKLEVAGTCFGIAVWGNWGLELGWGSWM